MILNGKAKEEFFKKHFESAFINLTPSLQNALIIDWFDSVGIYISINFSFKYKDFNSEVYHETTTGRTTMHNSISDNRIEAMNKAIKKAVEIYNSIHDEKK